MLSNLLELAGLGVLVAGVYHLAGTGCGLLALGLALLVCGLAADGVEIRFSLPGRRR